jgi:hypothetical protein
MRLACQWLLVAYVFAYLAWGLHVDLHGHRVEPKGLRGIAQTMAAVILMILVLMESGGLSAL